MQAVGPAPKELVVDLVNGWSPSVRREAGVRNDSPPLIHQLLSRHNVGGLLATETLDVAALAESLHRVFAAPAGERRRSVLNELIDQLGPTPMLTADGVRWRTSPGRDLEAMAIFTLVEHARDDPDLGRLGTCAAHRCVDVYVDQSQARVRRYCSLTCLSRAKAVAFRQMKAAARDKQAAPRVPPEP